MHNDAAMIQCPNCFCQALNPESNRFCQTCRTRLPKRYLWIAGAEEIAPKALIGDRYQVQQSRIVLDTKPGQPPEIPIDLLPVMEPYLRLVPYRLQVPQLYSVIDNRILLLEHAPIYPEDARTESGEALSGQMMPSIADVWPQLSALRQLNLLRQWAQLWQPMSQERVVSSLLDLSLLYVDNGLLRLLQLKSDSFREAPKDRSTVPTLIELGQFWAQWQVEDSIAQFFTQVCQNLIEAHITTADQLVNVFDQALATQSQQQSRQIQIATATDQGPSRQSNEDACYPPNGSYFSDAEAPPFVMVCDGIGGHEGGEVASELAIQTITAQIDALLEARSTPEIENTLDEAVFLANDAIAKRNDAEQRQERQRMGTTLVMGLMHDYELYITHVGDSRAYRITRTGCYQVTLDDDVASREVRLGYTLYRDALQHPSAGSLVQALGMGSSHYLHPNTNRFVIDEDCVFLLCSDGLSDHDRVDEYWATDIAPILSGKLDLATAARHLVEIANTRNGHDNVTVGLIYCRVQDHSKPRFSPRRADSVLALPSVPPALARPTQIIAPQTTAQPRPVNSELRPPRTSLPKIGLSLLALFGVASVLAVLLVPELRSTLVPRSSAPASPTVASPEPLPNRLTSEFIRLDRAVPDAGMPLLKNPEPPIDLSSASVVGQMPRGTVLKVLKQQSRPDQPSWVQLRVCTLGASSKAPVAASKNTNWVKKGDLGWQQEDAIASVSTQNLNLKADQIGECARVAQRNLTENPNGDR